MADATTKDRLAEIQARHKSADYIQTAGCNCFEQCWAEIDWLIAKVGRLQDAYEHSGETIEAYSESLTKAEAEIEQLQKEIRSDLKPIYGGNLKVTGIVHERKRNV